MWHWLRVTFAVKLISSICSTAEIHVERNAQFTSLTPTRKKLSSFIASRRRRELSRRQSATVLQFRSQCGKSQPIMPRRGKSKHYVLGAGGGVRWEICGHNTLCWITVQTLQGFCRLPRTHSCRATRQNSAVLSDTMAHHWSTKGPRGVLAVAAAAAAYFKYWIFNRVTWRRRVLSHARSPQFDIAAQTRQLLTPPLLLVGAWTAAG